MNNTVVAYKVSCSKATININSHEHVRYQSVLITFNKTFLLFSKMLFKKSSGVSGSPCITVEVVNTWSMKHLTPVFGDVHIDLSLLIQSTGKTS